MKNQRIQWKQLFVLAVLLMGLGSIPSTTFAEGFDTIKLFMAYTTAAKASTPDIVKKIEDAVARTNQSYITNNIPLRVKLAMTLETAYTESGDLKTDKERLVALNDNFFDELDSWKNHLGADILGVVTNVPLSTGICGLAGGVAPTEDQAKLVLGSGCLNGVDLTHEMGHLFGAQHNREAPHTDYPFSFGHGSCHSNLSPDDGWVTIMSYNTLDRTSDCYANPINEWSDPLRGKSRDPKVEDNARVLRLTGANVTSLHSESNYGFDRAHDKFGNALPLNDVYTYARVHQDGETDYFKFYSNGLYAIIIESESVTSTPLTDPIARVYDSNFNLVASDDDSGEGTHFKFDQKFPAGTYYLEVKPYYRRYYTGNYRIKLSSKSVLLDGYFFGSLQTSGNHCLQSSYGRDPVLASCEVSEDTSWTYKTDGTISKTLSGSPGLCLQADSDALNSPVRLVACNPEEKRQRWLKRDDGTIRIFAGTSKELCLSSIELSYQFYTHDPRPPATLATCSPQLAHDRWNSDKEDESFGYGIDRDRTYFKKLQLQQWHYYRIPAGKEAQMKFFLNVVGSGTDDADLYIQKDAMPTLTQYACRPYSGGQQAEQCVLNNAGVGTWYIGIQSYRNTPFYELTVSAIPQ